MLYRGRLRIPTVHTRSLSISTSHLQNHYETLGISQTASAKEVKTAFYELSKKYHPDTTEHDKDSASIRFQDIAAAYEILSSPDKRKVYDDEINPVASSVRMKQRMKPTMKNWTDIDIDYRDLEFFQRSARKRQAAYREYHEHSEAFARGRQYTSSRAFERAQAERRIYEEMEREREKSKFDMPTFEKLLHQEELRRRKLRLEQLSKRLLLFTLACIVYSILSVK